jgi:ureidoglycolate lyase
MRRLKPEPINAERFRPFGQIYPPRPIGEVRLDLIDELQNARPRARARLSLIAVAPRALPFVASQMERHVHSTQTFIPVDCSSYLVLVAPHTSGGQPDVSNLRAFEVPGNVAINYRADTWHFPLSALDRNARFAVLTFVDGGKEDDQFMPLSEPVTIDR